MDLFEQKNISPMLLKEIREPFDDDNYIFELKLDGIRCIAYLDKDKTILANKRNKNITLIYPELREIHKQANARCILDGEIIVTGKNGFPDFFALQKRSLLNDKFKIEMASKIAPVNFVAYDILYYDGKNLTNLDQMERKKLLFKAIKENKYISISRFIENQGIALFNQTKNLGLEGIVAKRKDGKYKLGKRSNEWIKIKNLQDEDFFIVGLTIEDGSVKDLILAKQEKNKLVYKAKMFARLSQQEKSLLLTTALQNKSKKPFSEIFKDEKDIVWIKPKLVCTVQYIMLTKDGNMRQPVIKGIRSD